MRIIKHRAAIEMRPEDMTEMVWLEHIFGIDTMKMEGAEAEGIIEFKAKYGKTSEGFPLYSLMLMGGRTNCYIGDEEE